MPTHCYAPVLGKRLRITELSETGAFAPTTGNKVATDGFITVTLAAEIEEGTEILQRNASGALCVNERLSDSFKRFTVEVGFCGVNPDVLSMITVAQAYADAAGDAAGFTIGEGELDSHFALELWTGIGGDKSSYGYLLLPHVIGGTLGDITVDGENAVTFTLTNARTEGPNAWGVGPANYLVVMDDSATPVPAQLPTALDPFDHLLLIDTAVAPPAVACSKKLINVA